MIRVRRAAYVEIVGLAVHPDGDVADARPGAEPGAQRPECPVVRGHGAGGESDCRTEELAALAEHGLPDDLVGPQQQRVRDCQAQRLGGLEVDDELELGGLLDRKIGGLGTFEDPVYENAARRSKSRLFAL